MSRRISPMTIAWVAVIGMLVGGITVIEETGIDSAYVVTIADMSANKTVLGNTATIHAPKPIGVDVTLPEAIVGRAYDIRLGGVETVDLCDPACMVYPSSDRPNRSAVTDDIRTCFGHRNMTRLLTHDAPTRTYCTP